MAWLWLLPPTVTASCSSRFFTPQVGFQWNFTYVTCSNVARIRPAQLENLPRSSCASRLRQACAAVASWTLCRSADACA